MKFQQICVIGDLHFEPPDEAVFLAARDQIVAEHPAAVVQLGDLGGYTHCGTWASFQEGIDLLGGLTCPAYSLIGNHDLEGPDYATDEDAVAAWCRAFGVTRPYRTLELGDALGICLSSTRFRTNPYSAHEVRIDAAQAAWFRATLAANRDRPTFVFAHAPVIGTGLRVLQSVHLRVPNAWLHHRDNPGQFLDILRENPQIKLWFSAHDHLSQDYPDSIAVYGHCVSVHTGVIGPVSRDGGRQSRLLQFNEAGWVLSTLDHRSGRRREDASHDNLTGLTQRRPLGPAPDETNHFPAPPMPTDTDRLQIDDTVFAVNRGMLVEYDARLQAPVGVVCEGLGDARVRIVGSALEIVDSEGETKRYRPDEQGRYGYILAPNTWRNRLRSA